MKFHAWSRSAFLIFLMISSVACCAEISFSAQSIPLLWTYEVENSNETISCLAVSDDGLYTSIGTQSAGDSGVYLFGKESNTPLWRYSVQGYVSSVSISASGDYLAVSVSGFSASKIYLFNTSSSVPLWSYSPEFGFGSIAISADGNYIAFAEGVGSVGETSKLYLFNRSGSAPLWTADIEAGGGANISISDDGNYIVAGGTQIYLFHRSSNTPLWTFQPSGAVTDVSISSNGSFFAVGTIGTTPSVYLFRNSASTPVWNYPGSAMVSISADGMYISGANRSYSGAPKGFALWRKGSVTPQWLFSTNEDPVGTSISNTGSRITGVEGGGVYLFLRESGLPVWKYPGAYLRSVVSGNGDIIAAYENYRLSLFDASFAVPREVWVDDGYCQTCGNGGHTWGYDAFNRIQAAVDALWMGGTVHVASGTYKEPAVYRGGGYENTGVFINRDNVKLIGAGRQTTFIDSDQAANRILITGKGCEVSGFTVRNSGSGYKGIFLYSGGGQNVVRGNTIINNGTGVELDWSGSSLVENNIIKNNGTGISNQDADGNVISRNTIVSNGTGITSHSDNTVIKNCLIAGNGSGVRAEYTSGDELINNTIADNDVGIYLFSCNATIRNNIIWGNATEMNLSSGSYPVSFCNVEGGWPGDTNTSLLPAFVDAANLNYRLHNYSSCIGRGTKEGVPVTDIENKTRPNPAGSSPDLGAYENSLGLPEIPPVSLLNTFGLELNNRWTYSGTKDGKPYTVEREITSIDQSSFPVPTYVMKIKENGVLTATEWYEDKGNQINLWGGTYEDNGVPYTVNFSSGLKSVWYPLAVGGHAYSTAGTSILGYPFNVSLTVDVLSYESVALNFDTIEAYKMRYQMRIWGTVGSTVLDFSDSFTWWVAPYVGVLRDQTATSLVKLTSFAIGGGAISQVSDSDGDNLSDYREIFVYNTHWQNSDTDGDDLSDGWEIDHALDPKAADSDGDGITDGWEVTYGLEPLVNDANEDLDKDRVSNLEEFMMGSDPTNRNDPRLQSMPWLMLLLE